MEHLLPDAEAFDADVRSAREAISAHAEKTPALRRATELNIATMTIMSKLDRAHINLAKVACGYDHEEGLDALFSAMGVGDDRSLTRPKNLSVPHVNDPKRKRNATAKRRRAAPQSFENAVILKYVDKPANDKAVKIFCNGGLHVNGCRTLAECTGVCDKVCRMLEFIYDAAGKSADRKGRGGAERFAITGFDVQLINTNMKLDHCFDLRALRAILYDEMDMDAEFEPERHPAVNIKFRAKTDKEGRNVTILVFDSGNVIVTGLVSAREMEQAYTFILTTLNNYLPRIELRGAPLERRLRMKQRKRAAPRSGSESDAESDEGQTNEKKKKKTKRVQRPAGRSAFSSPADREEEEEEAM